MFTYILIHLELREEEDLAKCPQMVTGILAASAPCYQGNSPEKYYLNACK
jgi:hypothetical protein